MKINKILEDTIPGLGFELVDIEITPAKIIRVFVDKDGGISVEDCAEISNHLSKVFLVEEIDYNRLEISSPGLERPLKKLQDYIKFIGRLAKIKTHQAIDNNKSFQGYIENVENEKITLKLESGDLFSTEFADISRGRLIYEPKKQESKKK
ncbi:MAG: ribosome maturation factor RimP [Burkholderiales bacterium]|nr:ribosome maturation factor RimP [Burkholderiales bacterium]